MDVERGAVLLTSLGCIASFAFKMDSVDRCRRDHVLRGLMIVLLAWVFINGIYQSLAWWPDIYNDPIVRRTLVQLDMITFPLGCLMLTALTRRKRITTEQCIRHLAPFVALVVMAVFWQSPLFSIVSNVFLVIYLSVMTYLIWRACHVYNEYVRNEFSDFYGRSTRWVGSTVITTICITAVWAAYTTWQIPLLGIFYSGMKCILWLYITHQVHRVLSVRETTRESAEVHNRELVKEEEQTGPAEIIPTAEEAAATAAPSRDPSAIFEQRLKTICEDGKLFTTEDLTREELAREMMVNHTYLTKMLKQTRGKSFYEYINGLRMDYAGQLLHDSSFPLDAIPLEVGYKHKSTYYRVFAEHYGCTPLEYRTRATGSERQADQNA